MDDYQLIKNNLELSESSLDFGKPWIYRWYILAFCFAPALSILLLSRFADDANILVQTGQIALSVGTFTALFQLQNKPLLNPIQAVVFLFHWWFAIGPCCAVLFAVLRHDGEMLSKYVASGGSALWLVAFGLPWYAYCANRTIRFFQGRMKHAVFLMPEGALYRPKTIYAYFILVGVVALLVTGLARMGIVGNQAINYLGGTISENWFVSALEAIGTITLFATVGAMGYLVGPLQQHSFKLRLLAICLIAFNTVNAFTSGWKGAIVTTFAILFIIMFNWKQKFPILLVTVLAVFYFILVEPFVNQTRLVAQVAHITTPEERTELFKLALSNGLSLDDIKFLNVNIESPFREIYEHAGSISSKSSMLGGPWSNTISDGFLALVPRAIYPEKPESNMGNFFARDLGAASPDDYIHNIGVSIPFEFTGNYGYFAGFLSFGLIGFLWTVFCLWLLSEARLATHPLTPLCIILSLGMEASVGQFLVKFRDLPIPLAAAYLVWILLKKRL